MTWDIGQRLDEHIRACDKRYADLDGKLDKYHQENRTSISRLYRGAWAIASTIIFGLLFIIYSLLHAKGEL